MSARLSPAAFTRTVSSPGPAVGAGTSWIAITSDPPAAVYTMARMGIDRSGGCSLCLTWPNPNPARVTLPMRLSVAALATLLACSDSSGPQEGDVPLALHVVATGLDFPVGLAVPPGDSRLFIVEKGGRIRIIQDGVLGPTFLDLRGRVS